MSLFKTATKVAVATSVHGRVQHRQQQKWAQQAAPVAAAPVQAAPVQAAPVAAAPAPAAAPAGGLDFETKVSQLKQLGELRDSGILTPEEFEVKKAQILNS